MNKVNLFLVGATKVGTKSLYHYLVNHEEIFAKIKDFLADRHFKF